MRDLDPVLITRADIQNMLGGISRTTFYRMRQRWKREGTPFPEPVNDIMPPKGGTLYRHKGKRRLSTVWSRIQDPVT